MVSSFESVDYIFVLRVLINLRQNNRYFAQIPSEVKTVCFVKILVGKKPTNYWKYAVPAKIWINQKITHSLPAIDERRMKEKIFGKTKGEWWVRDV